MAGLLDWFGGGGGGADDPYADILTPAQRNHMQAQGLLAMAGAFAQAGMPSRLPVPFGSALGSAAAALGTGQNEGMTAAIANAYKAQQVRDLRAKAALQARLNPIYQQILDKIRASGGADAAPGAGAAPGPGAAPGLPGPVGTGAPLEAGGGGLLSADFSLPSDTTPDFFTRGLAPKASGGLLDYPAASGGLGVGGGGLLSPDRETFGAATPKSEYAPGGSLYPFKDLGVVPGAGGGDAPAAAASQQSAATPGGGIIVDGVRYPNALAWRRAVDAREAADLGARFDLPAAAGAPTAVPEVTSVPGGTNGIDPRKRAALDAILGGMQTAQAGPSAGRLPQFAGPGAADAPAADAIPEGGGLLGVAPDLRAPIEANPFARQASPGDPRGVAPLIRQAMLRQGVDPNVALRVAQSEGLATFLGDAGKSGGAFQLYTGGGLGNEFQKQTGLDPLDPKNEAATIDWVAKNVNRTGWSPYHGAAKVGIGPRTGLPGGDLPPDEVIPSGPGAGVNRPPVMRAQYAPQGGGGLLAAPGAPGGPGLLVAPGAPGGPAPLRGSGGKIPGLGVSPEELAVIDAMAESAGLGNPFKGLLDTYYKSPGYLSEAERAKTQAQRDITEPSDIRIGQAKALEDRITNLGNVGLKLGVDGITVEKIPGWIEAQTGNKTMLEKAQQDERVAAERAIEQNKANMEIGTYTVRGTDGRNYNVQMPRYKALLQMQGQSAGAAPRPGDIVGTEIFNPRQTEIATGSAKLDLAEATKYRQEGDDALEARTATNLLLRNPQVDWQGPLAAPRQAFNRATASVLGLNTESVKSYEFASQLMGDALRKALRASDPNPTERQQVMMQASFPTPATSREGYEQGLRYMAGVQDWKIYRGEQLRGHMNNNNNDPAGFRVSMSAIPFVVMRMAPADQAAYMETLGRADHTAVSRLADQMEQIRRTMPNSQF